MMTKIDNHDNDDDIVIKWKTSDLCTCGYSMWLYTSAVMVVVSPPIVATP